MGCLRAVEPYGCWHSERGWFHVRNLPSRVSDWVVVHPLLWAMGSGAVLVLAGLALGLAPIVVMAAAAAVGALNVLHARRRGYCPLPAEPDSDPEREEAE